MSVVPVLNPHVDCTYKLSADNQRAIEVLNRCAQFRAKAHAAIGMLSQARKIPQAVPFSLARMNVSIICDVLYRMNEKTGRKEISRIRRQLESMDDPAYDPVTPHLRIFNLLIDHKFYDFLKKRVKILKQINATQRYVEPLKAENEIIFLINENRFREAATKTELISSKPSEPILHHQNSIERIIRGLLKLEQEDVSAAELLFVLAELIRNKRIRNNTYHFIERENHEEDHTENELLNDLDSALDAPNMAALERMEKDHEKYCNDHTIDLLIKELANTFFHPEVSDEELRAFIPRVAAAMGFYLMKSSWKKHFFLLKCNKKIKQAYSNIYFNSSPTGKVTHSVNACKAQTKSGD